MKLGLFGGTYDPIHIGHLIIAEWVQDFLRLDKIFFIPSGSPPHKKDIHLTDEKHRLEMTGLAISDNPKFELSHYEIKKSGKSFTIETVQHFHEKHGSSSELFWIIGSDNLIDMVNWYHPEKIIRLCQLVVYPRIHYPIQHAEKHFTENAHVLDSPEIDISSTHIRERVKQRKSVRYMVPQKVEEYIYKHQLYKNLSQ